MSNDIDMNKLAAAINIDWTVDPNTGSSNSSPAYENLVAAVSELLRNSAHDLKSGNTESVAILIMAQLAHVHGMAPANVAVSEATEGAPGSLFGYFAWNGRLMRFEATPIGEVETL